MSGEDPQKNNGTAFVMLDACRSDSATYRGGLRKQPFYGVANLHDGACFRGGEQLAAGFGEVGDHKVAGGAVGQQRGKSGHHIFGGEAGLQQLGDDASAGDEIDHRYGEIAVLIYLCRDFRWIADEAFGQREGEWGDSVDDDEGSTDDRGLDGCGAAGDDAGTSMIERFAGIVDHDDSWLGRGAERVLQEALKISGIHRGGDWDDKFVPAVSVQEGGRAQHLGQVELYFLTAAAWEEGDPILCGIECVLCGEFGPCAGRQGQLRQGVADECGVDASCAVEALFEGEDDHHAADPLLHPAEASALPGPELRTDEVDDGNVQLAELTGEAEVDVGEVDQDGDVGTALFDGGDQAAVLAVDARHVTNDFGDAHVGDVFGAHDAIEAGGFHLFAAEAEECGVGIASVQFRDELRAVVVPAGLAGGEKDARRWMVFCHDEFVSGQDGVGE